VLGELGAAVPSSMAAVSWLSRTLTMANSAATKKAFRSTMASTMTACQNKSLAVKFHSRTSSADALAKNRSWGRSGRGRDPTAQSFS
jgi:hypothetical protein